MANRDVKNIKKFIYNKLIDDSALVSLVGDVDNIVQQFPQKKVSLPLVFYSLTGEDTYPFEEDQKVSNIVESVIGIEIESDSSSTMESDGIENRVFVLLNGITYSNTKILIYDCHRTFYTQYFDSDSKVWKTITRYKVKSGTK